MNIRELTPSETHNIEILNQFGISSALLFITATGLVKSIFDATDPVRRFLKHSGFHDYETQQQGPQHKIKTSALFLARDGIHETIVSFYRPLTKQGDPRICPYNLARYASAQDIIAVLRLHNQLGFVNISSIDISAEIRAQSVVGLHLQAESAGFRTVSDELLERLKQIAASGPIESIGEGDTTIGMTLEHVLGIKANSRRTPDYKGIEIKSSRSKESRSRENRATLFACVPDWELSRLKSSAAILNEFGYHRDKDFKLYCTVSSKGPNSQGLFLKVDEASQLLKELATSKFPPDVAVWRIQRLEEQLASKHKETFWISARSEFRNGKEWFRIVSIKHTQNPNLPHLSRLLNDGGITVDHLIKRDENRRVREKGPLFKIDRPRLAELFLGVPKVYAF